MDNQQDSQDELVKKKLIDIKIDADELWKISWTYIRTVIDTLREPFLVLDDSLRVISANRTFYSFFQVAPESTEGKMVYELGDGQWNISALRNLLEEILPKNTFFMDFRVEHDFPAIGKKIVVLNARRVYVAGVEKPIILLAMEDITRQQQLEDQLKEYTDNLNAEVAKRTARLEEKVIELQKIVKTLTEAALGTSTK